jgi:leucyl/phenylalanyl-tRNA--protein transferase
MIAAYTALHERGFVHSVESWLDGELVGGLYGMALGKVFFGESMFTRAPDASKVALVRLVDRLRAEDFRLIDCQQATSHLASLGAREIPRAEFAQRVRESIQYPLSGSKWSPDNSTRG